MADFLEGVGSAILFQLDLKIGVPMSFVRAVPSVPCCGSYCADRRGYWPVGTKL